MTEERRKDYQELSEIKVQLAVLIERLDNLIELDLPKRVCRLENYKANIYGVCIGATTVGCIAGFIISNSIRLLGGH